mmetsp:Transcript_86948/g.173940  ORF Transcript_86948/g.173940 Transcript_86948/m.173940 type:complete len:735 (-) Transcript_86948:155-2359(-)
MQPWCDLRVCNLNICLQYHRDVSSRAAYLNVSKCTRKQPSPSTRANRGAGDGVFDVTREGSAVAAVPPVPGPALPVRAPKPGEAGTLPRVAVAQTAPAALLILLGAFKALGHRHVRHAVEGVLQQGGVGGGDLELDPRHGARRRADGPVPQCRNIHLHVFHRGQGFQRGLQLVVGQVPHQTSRLRAPETHVEPAGGRCARELLHLVHLVLVHVAAVLAVPVHPRVRGVRIVSVRAPPLRAVKPLPPVVAQAPLHHVVVPRFGVVGGGPVRELRGVAPVAVLVVAKRRGLQRQLRHGQALPVAGTGRGQTRGVGRAPQPLAARALKQAVAHALPAVAVAGPLRGTLHGRQSRVRRVVGPFGQTEPAFPLWAHALRAVAALPPARAAALVGWVALAGAVAGTRDLARALRHVHFRVPAVPARAFRPVPVGRGVVVEAVAHPRHRVAQAPARAVAVLFFSRDLLADGELGRARRVLQVGVIAHQHRHVSEVLREAHLNEIAARRAHPTRARGLHVGRVEGRQGQQLDLHGRERVVVVDQGRGGAPEAEREVAGVGAARESLHFVALHARRVDGGARQGVVARGAVSQGAVGAEKTFVAVAAKDFVAVPHVRVRVHLPLPRVFQACEVGHVLAHAVLGAVIRARQAAARAAVESVAALALSSRSVAHPHVAALDLVVRVVVFHSSVKPCVVCWACSERAVCSSPTFPTITNPKKTVAVAAAKIVARERSAKRSKQAQN